MTTIPSNRSRRGSLLWSTASIRWRFVWLPRGALGWPASDASSKGALLTRDALIVPPTGDLRSPDERACATSGSPPRMSLRSCGLRATILRGTILRHPTFPCAVCLFRAPPYAPDHQNQDRAKERRKQHDVVEALRTKLGFQSALDHRIGHYRFADNPAQQGGAGPDQNGNCSSSAIISAAPTTISGTLMARPIRMSAKLFCAAAAMAMTLSRLMTRSATARCAPRAKDDRPPRPRFRPRLPEQEISRQYRRRRARRNLEKRQQHQLRDHHGENNAQNHCNARAENHSPQPLSRREPEACHRDDDRVVARESRTLIHMILRSATKTRSDPSRSSRSRSWRARLKGRSFGRTSPRSTYDLVAGEKLRDFLGRRIGGVRSVHRVLADRLGVHLADGAGGRLGRIGCAHDVAVFRDRIFTFSTCTTTGPEIMNSTSSPKNGRCRCTA